MRLQTFGSWKLTTSVGTYTEINSNSNTKPKNRDFRTYNGIEIMYIVVLEARFHGL